MHLKNVESLREGRKNSDCIGSRMYWVPAGFVQKPVHSRPVCRCDQLSTEAQTEHGNPLPYCLPDQLLFLFDPQKILFIVYAHRTAKENKAVCVPGADRVIVPEMCIVKRDALF